MDDLIERQAAIDVIEAGRLTKLIDAETAVNGLKTLPPVQPEQRWIPVTEKLPKEDGIYIVSGVWGNGKKQVGECGFDVHDGYLKASWYFDVKAWMPLPKPYKGE